MSTGPSDRKNVKRDKYDWVNATHDLALTTHLTLNQASTLTNELSYTDLVPYEAVPRLRVLLNAPTDSEGFAEALRVLLTGDDRPTWELFAERRDAVRGG